MQKIKELEAEKKEVDKALRSIESQKKQKQREAEKAAKEAARAAKAAGKKAPANETKKGPKGPPHALIAVPRGFLSDRRFVLAAFIEDETSLQFATPHVMDDPYFNLVLWHFKRLFKGGIREEAFKVFKLSRDGALPEVLDKQLYAQLKCTTEWKDLPPEVVEVGEVTAEIVLKTMERERLEEKEIWLERLEHGALAMTNAPRYLTNDYHYGEGRCRPAGGAAVRRRGAPAQPPLHGGGRAGRLQVDAVGRRPEAQPRLARRGDALRRRVAGAWTTSSCRTPRSSGTRAPRRRTATASCRRRSGAQYTPGVWVPERSP